MRIDRDLDLAACIAGHKPAWDTFVRASAPVVYAAVRRALQRCGTAEDVDDRVQDVYVRLLQRDAHLLRTFDATKASLATWLTIIARTVVHEHGKRRSLPVSQSDTSEITTGDGPTERTRADLPWSVLSTQQRAVLRLLFDEELSVEQVAARLEIAAQTVRSAKHKALERLRTELDRLRGDATREADLYGRDDSDEPN